MVFVGGEEADVVQQGRETELTALFQLNVEEKEKHGTNFIPENMPKYVDMPGSYTFNSKKMAYKEARISNWMSSNSQSFGWRCFLSKNATPS